MHDFNLSKNNMLFSSVTDMQALCQPLFDRSPPLSWFGHGRFYNDGRCYYLSNDSRCIAYLFEQQYPLLTPIPSQYKEKKFHYLIPEDGPYSHVLHAAKSFFNLHSALDIIERHQGYVDLYCFAANSDRDIVNYYLNSADILEKFILYFKEKGHDLLSTAHDSCILQSPAMTPTLKGYENEMELKTVDDECFQSKKQDNQFFIQALYKEIRTREGTITTL